MCLKYNFIENIEMQELNIACISQGKNTLRGLQGLQGIWKRKRKHLENKLETFLTFLLGYFSDLYYGSLLCC